MFKFFRKIRKKLIDEGKLKHYLIYSIGEIILVVIGILIALQINNWNIEKQEQRKEYEFLLSLERELDNNIKNLEEIIVEKKNGDKSIQKILNLTGERIGQIDTIEKLDRIILTATNPFSFNFQDGVLKTLLNSGQLELISNDSLRFYLAGCHSMVNDAIEESQEAWRMTEEQLVPIMAKYYMDYWKPIPFSSKRKEMLMDREFHNVLKRVWFWNYSSIGEHESMNRRFLEMKRLIEKEKSRFE